jgi:hypothetical protein
MFAKEQARELTTLIVKQNIKEKKYSDKIITCNDFSIVVNHTRDVLCFSTLRYEQYMSAFIHPQFVCFSLKTKDRQGQHHPFFHAQTFKKLVLDHVNSLYENPLLMAKFSADSDNYQQFSQEFKKHNDKLLAARQTWTTKSNQLLGYDIKEKEDVTVLCSPRTKNIEDIEITYRKKL